MAQADSNLLTRISKGIASLFADKPVAEKKVNPHAYYYGAGPNNIQAVSISFNGEKNVGEMGPIKVYALDYEAIRLRSWQAYLESDAAQLIVNKYSMSVIGSGLKLQASPHENLLALQGITLDAQKFQDTIETYFENFSESKLSDYREEKALKKLMSTQFINKLVGGDLLVILRYKKGKITVQLIDGSHVWNPVMGNDYFAWKVPDNQPGAGNWVRNGIEYDTDGQVTAYYVRVADPGAGQNYYTGKFQRIEAKSKSTGLTMVYLVKGLEYRIDNRRGIPFLSAVLEALKKLERYKEATVGTAEERAKLSYQVVQQSFSNDENPLVTGLAKIRDADAIISDDVPRDINGINLSPTAVSSSNKQALFLPKGQEIKTLNQQGDAQLYFKEFFEANFNLACATVSIPPEVALSQYNSNYSASRAAIKDWQHTIEVNRRDVGAQFLQPIYELYLHILVLENKIDAPGYLKAFYENNFTVLNAYRHCHWIGSAVANIDPMKEVMAARLKLGVTGAGIPLSTVEKILIDLGEMESVPAIIRQYSKELKLTNDSDIEIPEDQQRGNNSGEDKENKKENDKKSKEKKSTALANAIKKVLNEDAYNKLMAEAAKMVEEDSE